MYLRLVDYLALDLAAASSKNEKKTVRRQYFRAVVTSLCENSLSGLSMPRSQKVNRSDSDNKVIVRYPPFWRRRPDDELDELYALLAPYFAHHANRGLRL